MFKRLFYTYKAAYSGLPAEAWLLSIVVLINRAGTMVLFFLSLYLTSQMGYSVAEAGQMISIYGIGSLFGAFVGGWLTDRIGAYRVQILSLALSAVFFILLAYMRNPWAIGANLFTLALISEAFRPANATAFSAICPPELRARGFGLLRLAVNLGIAIGPAIGGILATIDYALLFWIDGLTCLAAAMLIIRLIPTHKITTPLQKQDSDKNVPNPWRDTVYLMILFAMLAMGMVFMQIFSTWPLYMREVNLFREDQIGLLLTFNAIMIVIIEMPLIHRVEKKNPVKIMALGALFLFAGFSLTPLNPSYLFVIFTVALWTIGEMLVFPIMSGFIANRASDNNRGKYMGMYTLTFAMSFVFGPATGSFIYAYFGPDMLWTGVAFVGLFILIFFRFIHDYLRKK